MSDNTNTKTKSPGRPKGSVSTVNMPLSELTDRFAPETMVSVGTKWLKDQPVPQTNVVEIKEDSKDTEQGS